jgi:hypothetical protein
MTGPITSLTPAPLSTVVAQPPFSAGPQLQPQFDVLELLPETDQMMYRLHPQQLCPSETLPLGIHEGNRTTRTSLPSLA